MAFLRIISAQRATQNLVYSCNKNSRSINSVKDFRSEAATAQAPIFALANPTKQKELCYVNEQGLLDPKNSEKVKCNFSSRKLHQHQLFKNILFLPVYITRHTIFTKSRFNHSVVAAQEQVEDTQTKRVSTHKQAPRHQPNVPINPQRDPLDASFNDPIAAFKSKTTWELIRAYLVYTVCSIEPVVENNLKLMKFANAVLGDKLFTLLMKSTFYGHFVAGEDQVKIIPTLERLRSFGVKPILDYSVEEDLSQEEAEKREVESSVSSVGDIKDDGAIPQYHVEKSFADRRYKVSSARTYFYLNEATCERNMEIFIKCLEAVSGATFGTGITAIKLTALGRPQLLVSPNTLL